MRKALVCAGILLSTLVITQPSSAEWNFWAIETVTPDGWGICPGWGVDGRIYDQNGFLLKEGALVQFIVDTEGDGLDDPLEYFDANQNGHIDSGVESNAVQAWLNDGADPSGFCDDELLMANNWGGTAEIGEEFLYKPFPVGPGEVFVFPRYAYEMLNGAPGMVFTWRAWSLTREELGTFGESSYEAAWYMTGHEIDCNPEWKVRRFLEFNGAIGWEVWMHEQTGDPLYRSQLILDHNLTPRSATMPIPEPGTMLLAVIGGCGLLWCVRWKKTG